MTDLADEKIANFSECPGAGSAAHSSGTSIDTDPLSTSDPESEKQMELKHQTSFADTEVSDLSALVYYRPEVGMTG